MQAFIGVTQYGGGSLSGFVGEIFGTPIRQTQEWGQLEILQTGGMTWLGKLHIAALTSVLPPCTGIPCVLC